METVKIITSHSDKTNTNYFSTCRKFDKLPSIGDSFDDGEIIAINEGMKDPADSSNCKLYYATVRFNAGDEDEFCEEFGIAIEAEEASFVIRSRESGDVIDECSTREEAESLLASYEEADKKDGIYEEDFYEVVEK